MSCRSESLQKACNTWRYDGLDGSHLVLPTLGPKTFRTDLQVAAKGIELGDEPVGQTKLRKGLLLDSDWQPSRLT